jgi:hypothetical protein
MFQAFDDAWRAIADQVGPDPKAIEATRLRLANVILSLAGEGADDAAALKNAALRHLS